MRINGWRDDTGDLDWDRDHAHGNSNCILFCGSISVEQAGRRVPNAVAFEYKLVRFMNDPVV